MSCPCGSGAPDTACCAPWIAGGHAPTAVALMRSRYTAYVRGEIAYLLDTHDAATRAKLDVAAITRWSRDTQWLGLEIVAHERGGPGDDDGVVEFIARGVTRGAPFVQRERSRFRRSGGRWFYVDGAHAPAQRVVTAGRNDPCPCGSGQKYKRCHGA